MMEELSFTQKEELCGMCSVRPCMDMKKSWKVDVEKCFKPREDDMEGWLSRLLEYAEGKIKWDTGRLWVCENHPRLPWGMGYSFDCKCGGPGMPPFFPQAWNKVGSEWAKDLRQEALKEVYLMATASLDPVSFEKIEAVFKQLAETRSLEFATHESERD